MLSFRFDWADMGTSEDISWYVYKWIQHGETAGGRKESSARIVASRPLRGDASHTAGEGNGERQSFWSLNGMDTCGPFQSWLCGQAGRKRRRGLGLTQRREG